MNVFIYLRCLFLLLSICLMGYCPPAISQCVSHCRILSGTERVRNSAVCGFLSISVNVLLFCVSCHVTASNEDDWRKSFHCIETSHTECDLSSEVRTNSTYNIKIQTEPVREYDDYTGDVETFPYNDAPPFNPFRETNISAVEFSVAVVDKSRVNVTIKEPLSGIHEGTKQLTLRDILQSELMYKISYYKFGSTGKRDIISNCSTAEVSQLEAGQSYCFMVAAFIPTRPKSTQQGAWSTQRCTPGHEPSPGVWVGAVFILLTFLVIIILVTVLYCKCCQQNDPSQTSTPV